MKKIFEFIKKVNKWFSLDHKRGVMHITLDWDKNEIECLDWLSQKINCLSGQFTLQLWSEIKPYCRPFPNGASLMGTQIGIWKNGKCIVQSDIIDEYLKNTHLLKTGNGYKNYWFERERKKAEEKKCPHCGHGLTQ